MNLKENIKRILREETIGDERVINQRGYWTFDKVKQEAEKYNTRSEFSKGSPSAYNVAYKEKWLDDVTKHMYAPYKGPIQRPIYWTFDKVKQEAKKYDTRGEFRKGSSSAYGAAYKNEWLDDVTSHMRQLRVPNGYWTFDKVKQEAEKYNTKSDFQKNSGGAYYIAVKNKWLDDVTKHMEVVGDRFNRLIYSFEFPDKSVYVGLTYNEKMRYTQHMRNIKSVVYKYMKETGLVPVFKKETHYISQENAIKMEEYVEDWYRQNGWKILNVAKTGGLGGGNLTWTYDKVKQEAEKYTTRKEFRKNSPSVFTKAYKEKWLDDVTKHMSPPVKWTYDKVKQEAEKYNTSGQFQKNSASAFQAAKRNEWLDDVTKHMEEYKRPIYWTYDRVKQEAEKYNTKVDFMRGSGGAFIAAKRNEWLDDVTKHMEEYKRPIYWTYDRVKQEAEKYNTRGEFSKGSTSAYGSAYRNEWLDDFFPKDQR